MTKRGSRRRILINVALVVLAIITALSFDPVLKVVTGCTRMVVEGTSMLPNLREGDYVFIKSVAPTDIKVGDIIVFDKYVRKPGDTDVMTVQPNPPWIHRVVDIENESGALYFKTEGDNNRGIEDPGWIPEQGVLGKLVFDIPFLGSLSVNPLFRVVNISLIVLLVSLMFYAEVKGSPSKETGKSI